MARFPEPNPVAELRQFQRSNGLGGRVLKSCAGILDHRGYVSIRPVDRPAHHVDQTARLRTSLLIDGDRAGFGLAVLGPSLTQSR